jgi:hypothetical protein
MRRLPRAFHLRCLTALVTVTFRTVDPHRPQRLVQNVAGESDKRPSDLIFLVTGLFANKDDINTWAAFPENRLSRLPVQITGPTIGRGFPESSEITGSRYATLFDVICFFPRFQVTPPKQVEFAWQIYFGSMRIHKKSPAGSGES